LVPTQRELELRLQRGPTLPRQITFDGGLVTPGLVRWLALPSIDRVICVNLNDPESWWELRGEGVMGPLTCAAISPDTNWIATRPRRLARAGGCSKSC
jgi:hypothetical protein